MDSAAEENSYFNFLQAQTPAHDLSSDAVEYLEQALWFEEGALFEKDCKYCFSSCCMSFTSYTMNVALVPAVTIN